MRIRHWLEKAFIPLLWGRRFYAKVLGPFDRILVPADTGAAPPPALNALCRHSDARDADWRRGAEELGLDLDTSRFHRKGWEFAQVIYGLRRLRLLTPGSELLDIGAGHEELIYFLANRVKRVHAVDLYADPWAGGEGEDDVLIHPEKYAPFAFERDRLRLARMDARQLDFADESFDAVVSLSAIEHFGKRREIIRALREMQRVLKPGGVAAITTEVRLNRLGGRHDSFPLPRLLALAAAAGFAAIPPPRLSVEEEFLRDPVALPMETRRTPHVVLRFLNTIFTSFSLFLVKPPSVGPLSRQAVTGDEQAAPLRPFVYRAAWSLLDSPRRVAAGERFAVRLEVENSGDVGWFRNRLAPAGAAPVFPETRSPGHAVRLGVTLLGRDGPLAGYRLCRFELPRDVGPGERVTLELDFPPIAATGDFVIRLDMLKELCFWFADRGSPVIEIPLAVI
jgi:SAM-dependent methyltransferase